MTSPWNRKRFRWLAFAASLFALPAAGRDTRVAPAVAAMPPQPRDEDATAQYRGYLRDTLASLEAMRGATGLVKDSIWVCWDADLGRPNFRDTEPRTGPTNIGLDLILLSQRFVHGDAAARAQAHATLGKLLATLANVPYHHANGLFFRTYWPDTGQAESIHLSSVDNLHLAFGLWVAHKSLAEADPSLANVAKALFDRMDLSDFYNEGTGLIGGNMRPVGENNATGVKGDPQGDYVRDSFDYKYFGSESRSLYALAWALGLYRKAEASYPDFAQRMLTLAIPNTDAEIATVTVAGKARRLLRTWDGGGFQALLPAVLVREERYSPILAELHQSYAALAVDANASGVVPRTHSASAFGVKGLRLFRSGDATFDRGLPIYNGKAGHVALVATMHEDVKDPNLRRYWDIVHTPHPAFMAATFAREEGLARAFAAAFRASEALASATSCVCRQSPGAINPEAPSPRCECASRDDLGRGNGQANACRVATGGDAARWDAKDRLYTPGWGWLDGVYVGSALAGRVVPVLISLDQAMIALSLETLLSPDGHHVGSEALAKDPDVARRLAQAYAAIDAKLATLSR